MTEPQGRTCTKCGIWKPADDFRRQPRGKDGLHSICRPCGAAYARRKYADDPDKHRAAALASWRRADREVTRRRRRSYALRALYGLTVEQFEEMLAGQGGCCAACGCAEPNGVNWHVDHDHDTGVVRGILCHPCNTAIGLTRESPDRLLALAGYLLSRVNAIGLPVAGLVQDASSSSPSSK